MASLALQVVPVLPGCMTIVNQAGYWTDSSVGHATDPHMVIYGGTRSDLITLCNVFGPRPGLVMTSRDWASAIGLTAFILVDTPLSFVADTILLPLTLGEEWWMRNHEDDRPSHEK